MKNIPIWEITTPVYSHNKLRKLRFHWGYPNFYLFLLKFDSILKTSFIEVETTRFNYQIDVLVFLFTNPHINFLNSHKSFQCIKYISQLNILNFLQSFICIDSKQFSYLNNLFIQFFYISWQKYIKEFTLFLYLFFQFLLIQQRVPIHLIFHL